MNLDTLAAAARGAAPWDEARAARVLGSTLRRREEQVARARVLRRGLVLASGALAVVLCLLRSAAGAPNIEPALAQADLVADIGDGGYSRD